MTTAIDKTDIFNRCKKIISEMVLVTDDDRLTPGAAFIDDLAADSLDMIELVMSAEGEFDIQISHDEAEQMVTVQDAVDAIAKKLA